MTAISYGTDSSLDKMRNGQIQQTLSGSKRLELVDDSMINYTRFSFTLYVPVN